jgi:predicted nucleic acid-binding protein
MRLLNIYIETSVFNFYFSEQSQEKRQHALKLFEGIKEGKYAPYTSAYVVEELASAPEPKSSLMLGLIAKYGIAVLPIDPNSERLADAYLDEGVIPDKYRTDGIHIAVTAVSHRRGRKKCEEELDRL